MTQRSCQFSQQHRQFEMLLRSIGENSQSWTAFPRLQELAVVTAEDGYNRPAASAPRRQFGSAKKHSSVTTATPTPVSSRLQAEASFFSCCDATGWQLQLETQRMHRCPLQPCLSKANALYAKILAQDTSMSLSHMKKLLESDLQGVAQLSARMSALLFARQEQGGKARQGQWESSAMADTASLAKSSRDRVWLAGMCLNWYSSWKIEVFSFGDGAWQKFFSELHASPRALPHLLVVHGISTLWQAEQAWRFEQLVAACYQYQQPFYFLLDTNQSSKSAAALQQKSEDMVDAQATAVKINQRGLRFQQKVASLKQATPAQWLSQQCQMQLFEMTGKSV